MHRNDVHNALALSPHNNVIQSDEPQGSMFEIIKAAFKRLALRCHECTLCIVHCFLCWQRMNDIFTPVSMHLSFFLEECTLVAHFPNSLLLWLAVSQRGKTEQHSTDWSELLEVIWR